MKSSLPCYFAGLMNGAPHGLLSAKIYVFLQPLNLNWRIAYCQEDNKIRNYDLDSNKEIPNAACPGEDSRLTNVCFNPKQKSKLEGSK